MADITYRRRAARTAEVRYAAHTARAEQLAAMLPRTPGGALRSRLMLRLHAAAHYRGTYHDQAAGPKWCADGQTMRVSLAWEAALWRALSDAEFAAAAGTTRIRLAGGKAGDVEAVAGRILDRIAAIRDLPGRLAVYPALRVTVLPLVGERAVSAVFDAAEAVAR
ncbi:hypothetical protein C1I95_33780 [Micromonospora craterilacus]|uniref:Uncharacterized protein n=1 Tax=Micromonospora craterilacus TaxID=1655439 RepID=A0A2W2CZY7_9ACTN|nr:hypothetical protein [Micromonospora craterilacus]PZG03491.1 hypothetical protein C1I95_33780 [Micromonospora craterilacus]